MATLSLQAQQVPLFGAQVFIEPGQTDRETEGWFRTMSENGMAICRIRMFESYMRQPGGTWDFSLFDRAFDYAEKYDIKVMGTFFPATEKTDIGGWKFPETEEQLQQFAEFIKALTTHYKDHKALHAWVLINEPGGGLSDTPFSRMMKKKWLQEHPQKESVENGYPVLVDLQEGRFAQYMTSWMLQWIANEVRKHDSDVHLHVNPHAIFQLLPEFDFTQWRSFLNSLGGSAHASWHFYQFERPEYALAMSLNCEILRAGAGPLPWLMTELQGGNNTYSGSRPMNPTPEEVIQWLWLVMATEGKGSIFWTLNPRASGVESGEWALLDFQHQPTERVAAIHRVSQSVRAHSAIIGNLKKVDPGVTLLYVRESLWAERAITEGRPSASDGRVSGLLDLFGYFKAFSAQGITPNVAAIEEYDFEADDFSGQSIVLANQIALPRAYREVLEGFVRKGGTLWVGGLTGYYDEDVHNQMLTGFPYSNLFGGNISEFRYIDQPYTYTLQDFEQAIPTTGWMGLIKPEQKAEILSQHNELATAIRYAYGKGKVIWVPSLLGRAAWEGNAMPLSEYLQEHMLKDQPPFAFTKYQSDILMKTLRSGEKMVTVLINKSAEKKDITMKGAASQRKPQLIFSSGAGRVNGNKVHITPEETLVIVWE